MDYDPPEKKDRAPGGGLIDLPMGPGAPAPGDRRSPPERGAPAPSGRPGGLGSPATTPRHQRRSRASRPRRSGRYWPVWLVLLLAAGAAGYWFFLRPPKARASLSLLEFGSARVGRDGEEAAVEISNGGRRPLEIRGVRVGGAAADDFSILDDGCTGASLAAEQSCAVALIFRPQAAGGRGAGLEIASNAPGEPLGIPLAGTGLAPTLTADRQSLDFGRIAVGKASGAAIVSLTNTGSAPMAVARMAIEGSGESSFVWVANGCSGKTLEAGEACAVRIAFQPREAGQFKAELRVWSDAPEDPRVVVSGLGVAPGLFVQPAEIDFGELRPGQRSGTERVRLENTGNAALEISRLELAGVDREAFAIEANDCEGKALGAEATCSVDLSYRPSGPARHQATLRIRAPGLRQRREVRLTGVALAPRLAVSATILDFGRVVQYGTHERSLKLSNTGSAPLRLESIEIEGGGGAYGISDRGCPRELAAGAECSLGLRYSPSGLGATEARLRLGHDAAGSPLLIRLLGTATALPKPAIAVEPGELGFGALPVGERSDILTVKVRSTGGARLELGGYELVGENAGDFRIVPASCEGLRSLLPGSDCTIGVRFRPQGAGPRRARIVVRHGASGGSSRVDLRGEGF